MHRCEILIYSTWWHNVKKNNNNNNNNTTEFSPPETECCNGPATSGKIPLDNSS